MVFSLKLIAKLVWLAALPNVVAVGSMLFSRNEHYSPNAV